MSDKGTMSTSKPGPRVQPTTKQNLLQPRSTKTRSPRVRKRKRRFDPTEKLPTPPPDPRDMEKTTGERCAKRKSLEENKENLSQQQDEQQSTSTSRRVSADVASASALAFAEAFSGTEEAFQHLDKLHSLMEQILELREKNSRLFRRVRDLERCKALRKLEASSRSSFFLDPILPDDDIGFAESLLSAMLAESSTTSASSVGNQSPAAIPTTPNQEVTRSRSFRAKPIVRQRSRSIGTEGTRPFIMPGSSSPSKRSSCHLQYPSSKTGKRNSVAGFAPPKVSKWTKVKAAFKWERAGTGTGPTPPALSSVVLEALEHDAARFLRLPEPGDGGASGTTATTTPSGSSPRTAEHSCPPSPGTLSSSSSTDDVYNGMHKRIHGIRSIVRETEEDPSRRRGSFDSELIIPHNIQYATQHSRDGVTRRLEKGLKTPWGMVKDIIQSRREPARRGQTRGSLRSEDGYSLSSLESSDMIPELLASDHLVRPRVQITTSEGSLAVSSSKPTPSPTNLDIVDLATRRLTPTLTITVPSSEELRSVSSPESVSPPTSQQHQQQDSTDERSEDPDGTASSPKCRSSADSASSVMSVLRERRRSANASAISSAMPIQGGSERLPRLQRQDSKWNKVKRAFLTGASSVPPSPSRMSSFFDETDGGGSYSASAEDLDNNNGGGASPTIQADIQRNYQLLHDKLSVEFNRKLAEWDRLKSNGQAATSTPRSSSATSPRDKDSANALLMGEEQLTPEFKKKLQEWKRMKKTGGGTTSPEPALPQPQQLRRRLTDWQIWRTPTKTEGKNDATAATATDGKSHLSEDFLKKMDEWKKIKSARSDEEQSSTGRRDSAETIYQQNYAPRWKALMDEREFQPLDRVIAMIEREQQRLEKQREKLLDKKSRLNELSRVMGSIPAKKEVLVHTSSGFYRFEGISQEFTRKLYEWEKSQGIAPESSTLQLLNPAYSIFQADQNAKTAAEKGPRALKRSKSMSSVVESSARDEAPIRQPSSLSLNDVTNLENEAKLRIDSKQTIGEEEMSEELVLDDSEPEAVIVDIEDVIEETASPMARFQPQQTPVYSVTQSETTSIAIPLGTVTASHEPSPVILIQAGENHHRVKKFSRFSQSFDETMLTENTSNSEGTQSTSRTEAFEGSESVNDENRKRIFEPSDIIETIIEEEMTSSHIEEEFNTEPDVSNVIQTAYDAEIKSSEKVKLQKSAVIDFAATRAELEHDEEMATKEDGKRKPGTTQCSRSVSDVSPNIYKNVVLPSSEEIEDDPYEDAKDTIEPNTDEPTLPIALSGDIRKTRENDDEAVITVSSSSIRQKKILKTRRLTDTQVGYKWRQSTQKLEEASSPEPTVSTYSETPSVERIIINESTLGKIVVPTASNEQLANIEPKKSASGDSIVEGRGKADSKSVFVKTKRIIFSPFSRRNSKEKPSSATHKDDSGTSESSRGPIELPAPSKSNSAQCCLSQKRCNIQKSRSSSDCPPTTSACEKRPPLPQSPVLARKEYRRSSPKETAPSIRMMIQRYNQKLQEDAGSPASSGSGSPLWRSPTSERRVRAQMEKYQEEVRRAIAGPRSSNVEGTRLEKSASVGVIRPARRGEILKSTSADFTRNPDFVGAGADEARRKAEETRNGDSSGGSDRRKNSLQDKTPEIFSNIRQCLAHESKTLPIRSDSTEDRRKSDSGERDFLDTPVVGDRLSGKLSPELIYKLNALSGAANQTPNRYSAYEATASENSTPLRIRAQRIKQAKDDFFSRGPSCHSHDPSVESTSSTCTITDADDASSGNSAFVKSASAGMINVDPRTYHRLKSSEASGKSPENSKSYTEVSGTLSKIASKFRRAKLKRGKERDKEKERMGVVSMLCRQSLLVDIEPQQPDEMSKSCPTSPSPQREEDEHRQSSRFKKHRDSG